MGTDSFAIWLRNPKLNSEKHCMCACVYACEYTCMHACTRVCVFTHNIQDLENAQVPTIVLGPPVKLLSLYLVAKHPVAEQT